MKAPAWNCHSLLPRPPKTALPTAEEQPSRTGRSSSVCDAAVGSCKGSPFRAAHCTHRSEEERQDPEIILSEMKGMKTGQAPVRMQRIADAAGKDLSQASSKSVVRRSEQRCQ